MVTIRNDIDNEGEPDIDNDVNCVLLETEGEDVACQGIENNEDVEGYSLGDIELQIDDAEEEDTPNCDDISDLPSCDGQLVEDYEFEILQLQIEKEILGIEMEKQTQKLKDLHSLSYYCHELLKKSLTAAQNLTSHLRK